MSSGNLTSIGFNVSVKSNAEVNINEGTIISKEVNCILIEDNCIVTIGGETKIQRNSTSTESGAIAINGDNSTLIIQGNTKISVSSNNVNIVPNCINVSNNSAKSIIAGGTLDCQHDNCVEMKGGTLEIKGGIIKNIEQYKMK